MKSIFVSFLVFIIAAAGLPLKAQEKQVPFFPEQQVITIDRNYAKKMSFFAEYDDFVEARLFITPEKTYALEIFYEVNDSLYKDRKLLTFQEKEKYLDDLLLQYAATVHANNKSGTGTGSDSVNAEIRVLNQKGRSAMLVMNTAAGLGFYGYALPLTLQVDDEKAFVGLYMLAAGASFYIPYRITQHKDVTLAQASLNFYGISRGAMHGAFLGELFSKEPSINDYYTFDPYEQPDYWNNPEYIQAEKKYDAAEDRRASVLFGMGMVGSIAGGIAGYNLAEQWEYDGGSTSIFQMWGDLGTISGLLLSDVFDFYDNEELDAAFGITLSTSILGMAGGKLFGDSRNYTLGDAIVYRSSIAMSTLPLLTIVDYFDPEDETAYTVAGLAGIAAGGYLGWRATHHMDFDTGDGVFIALGELAGGLLGLGIGYLVAPDFESEILLTSATLGALGGYGLMYSGLKKNALTFNSQVDLDLRLNPMGLFMNQLKRPYNPAMAQMYTLGSLNLRF
ncbi:MAG: hypothetical protein K9G38_06830 [Bacteroidales bacterium]|nr:hypothetical protein [Bacteroidales bacterium]